MWEGLNVVKTGRVMLGETNPADSKPGTIRGDFCIQVGRLVLSCFSLGSTFSRGRLFFREVELLVANLVRWGLICRLQPIMAT